LKFKEVRCTYLTLVELVAEAILKNRYNS